MSGNCQRCRDYGEAEGEENCADDRVADPHIGLASPRPEIGIAPRLLHRDYFTSPASRITLPESSSEPAMKSTASSVGSHMTPKPRSFMNFWNSSLL